MVYTNDNNDISIEANETIGFSMVSNQFNGFYSFTPENYAYNSGNLKSLSMIGFRQGEPWFFNISTVSDYNNFFGEQCDMYVKVVCNESPQTEKRYQAVAIDSKNKTSNISGVRWGGDEVITSDNLESSIPIAAFQFRENWYYAVFYRSTSNNMTLQTGAQIRGDWAEILLKRDDDPDVIGTYSELAKIIVFFMTSSKAIT